MTSRNSSCSVADAATAGGVVGGRAANVDLENLQPGQQRLVAAKLAARGGASSRTARCRTAFIDITNAVGKGISDGKKSMGVLGVRKVALKASNRLNNNNNNTALNAAVRMQTRAGAVHNGGAANGGVSVVAAGKQQRRSVKRSALGSALAATASELARLSKTRKSKKLRSVPTLSDLPSALTAECSSSSSSSMTSSSDSNTITSGAGLTSSSSLLFVKDSLSDDVTSSLSAAHETCDVTSDVTTEGESAQNVLVEAEIGDKNEIEQVVDVEQNESLTEPTLSNPVTCNSTSTSSTAVGKQTRVSSVAASLPEGVIDFDAQTDDIYSVSNYVSEVFHYYLQCEECMLVRADYLATTQADLTEMMRAILVDWMVEVQESFELNHETLYTAVRLVDIYLCHVAVSRDTLQLIGATALFIACKFDERLPPPLDDFLYICEDAYTRQEVIDTEVKLLRVVEFRLGLPISYRFLRRYARCCKLSMEVLTLSRYILELSLMEYGFVAVRGSLLAAGALTLALLMKLPDQVAPLMPTIQHYSGYQADEFRAITEQLNNMLHKPANSHLKTIRAKYSHRVFFEVAKVALVKSPLEF